MDKNLPASAGEMVPSLVREDSTSPRQLKPVLQLLKPRRLEPVHQNHD